MSQLTHIGPDGRARMVDISQKSVTERVALARGRVQISNASLSALKAGGIKKGDPIAISELAGIIGAKKTADLIPLCHPLPLTGVNVQIEIDETASSLIVSARVKTTGKTGVEMEALTAVSVSCLTLYDMLKAIDKSMIISDIELIEKSGGRSGEYKKPESES